jgi:hypothetical protein
MKTTSNPEFSFEAVAKRVGVSSNRVTFLKKFYDTYSDNLVMLREAAIVNRLSGKELHAVLIFIGQSIYLKTRKP